MSSEEERQQREAVRLERAIFRIRLAQAFRRRAQVVWLVTAVVFLLSAVVIAGHRVQMQDLSRRIMLQGALFTERVHEGELWRVISGTWMHLDWSHLLLNLLGIVLVGRHVEVAFGRSGFVSLYVAAALAGAYGTMLSGHALSVGASGGLLGLLGAFLAVGTRLWSRLNRPLRNALVGVPIAVIVGFFVIGLLSADGSDRTDHAAHLGGLIAGFGLGRVLPLRLRDAEGAPLDPRAPPVPPKAVYGLATLLTVVVVWGFGTLWTKSHASPKVNHVATKTVRMNGHTVHIPSELSAGLWRGQCEGAHMDVQWALERKRTVCWRLPMLGKLLLGRPSQLMTLDDEDVEALTRARDEGRFVWRQDSVLISPAGGPWMYVVLGHEAMLSNYGGALKGLLPLADQVRLPKPRVGPQLRAAGKARPTRLPLEVSQETDGR